MVIFFTLCFKLCWNGASFIPGENSIASPRERDRAEGLRFPKEKLRFFLPGL